MKDNISLEEQKQRQIDCFNCRHTWTDMDREPCASCDDNFSNWKSRKEERTK